MRDKMLQFGFLFIFIISGINAWDAPDYITICKRYDPNLKDCWRKNFESVVPLIKDGIPDLNIKSPLVWDHIEMLLGNPTDPVYLEGTLKNITVYGLENSKLDYVHISMDPKNMTFSANISVKHINFHAGYSGKGKFMLINVNSNGKIFGDLYDGYIVSDWSTKFYNRDGVKYFRFDVANMDMDFVKASVKFTNLFENNPELSNSVNKLVNENINKLFVEFKPVVVETIKAITEKIVKDFVDTVPADELYPID